MSSRLLEIQTRIYNLLASWLPESNASGAEPAAPAQTILENQNRMYDLLAARFAQMPDEIADAVLQYLEDHPEALNQAAVEAILDGRLDGIEEDLGGLKSAFNALLTALEHVAWTDENGQTYWDAIYDALHPSATLTGISAVYTQSGTVYTTDSLDSLKADLVVTASYDDGTTATIASTAYTLSGTLVAGTSTVTVTYGGQTDTFSVTVTEHVLPAGYTAHDYIYNTQTSNAAILRTGLAPTYNGMGYEHEIEFAFHNTPSTSAASVYGLRSTTGSDPKSRAIWVETKNQVTKLAVNYGGTDTGYVYPCTTDTKYKSVTKNGNWYINDTLVSDNLDTGSYDAPSNGTICIFGIFTNGGVQSGAIAGTRVYGFKVTEISSDTVVADLKPCTNPDGVAGFYDVVRQEFFNTDTTTMLAAGDDA